MIITGSMDKTCKIWDSGSGQCRGVLIGHEDEVLDVVFDYTGQFIATASADCTARIYNAFNYELISKLEGHQGEISKVNMINI
jgi:dynein assembly factor with WDR repeat domains 1